MNPKHQLFCDTYLTNGRNATQAYLTVYKSKSEDTARKLAPRLMANDVISDFLMSKITEHSKNVGITLETQLAGLDKVKELAMMADDKGKRELTAFVKATEVQNKMLGLDAPTKLELTGKDGGKIQVDTTLTLLRSRLQDSEEDDKDTICSV